MAVFSYFFKVLGRFQAGLMKIFAHFFHFGHISGSSLDEFLSHFCFVLGRLGGGFWPFTLLFLCSKHT